MTKKINYVLVNEQIYKAFETLVQNETSNIQSLISEMWNLKNEEFRKACLEYINEIINRSNKRIIESFNSMILKISEKFSKNYISTDDLQKLQQGLTPNKVANEMAKFGFKPPEIIKDNFGENTAFPPMVHLETPHACEIDTLDDLNGLPCNEISAEPKPESTHKTVSTKKTKRSRRVKPAAVKKN